MPSLRTRKRQRSPSADERSKKNVKIEKSDTVTAYSEGLPLQQIGLKVERSGENVAKKTETTESDSDSDEELGAYEKRRLQNIKENAEFLAQLGIGQAKNEYLKAIGKAKETNVKPTKIKKEKAPPAPRRASLRLQRINPEGVPLPPEPVIIPVEEHPRKPPGPLEMSEYVLSGLTVEEHNKLINSLQSIKKKNQPMIPSSQTLSNVVKEFKKLSIQEKGVMKVVPDRIFSLDIHPSGDIVLAATGDKWGKLGFWDVLCQRDDTYDGVLAYSPHSRPINCTRFSPYNWSQIFTCSYDGTMRGCDIERAVFDEIYSLPDDNNLLKSFDFLSADTVLVSQQDGDVALVDTRTKGAEAEHLFWLHDKSLRTVSVHPVDKNIFVTASTDNTVKVWDLRALKSQRKKNHCLDFISHNKSVDSAYFSPVTGKYLLSSSIDNRIQISECSSSRNLKVVKSMPHDNQTGRWLTNFRPTWHPTREDMFIVGSMKRPRQIELYSTDGSPLHTLTNPEILGSVCCLNVIHPTRNVVVGGNSSGRLHVFM